MSNRRKVQRYQADPEVDGAARFMEKAINAAKQAGDPVTDAEQIVRDHEAMTEFVGVARRASLAANPQQYAAISSLKGQAVSPLEATAAIRAIMGWENEDDRAEPHPAT